MAAIINSEKFPPSEDLALKKLQNLIDFTNLWPFATKEDIQQLAKLAHQEGAAAVCVSENRVSDAYEIIEQLNSCLKVSAGISYPFGDQSVFHKAGLVRTALLLGARELDIVTNIGALRDKKFKDYEFEIEHLLDEVKSGPKRNLGYAVKFAVESFYLNLEELTVATSIIARKAHDFPQIKVYINPATGFWNPEINLEGAGERINLSLVTKLRETLDRVTESKYVVGIKVIGEALIHRSALEMMVTAGCLAENGQFKRNCQDYLRIDEKAFKVIQRYEKGLDKSGDLGRKGSSLNKPSLYEVIKWKGQLGQ